MALVTNASIHVQKRGWHEEQISIVLPDSCVSNSVSETRKLRILRTFWCLDTKRVGCYCVLHFAYIILFYNEPICILRIQSYGSYCVLHLVFVNFTLDHVTFSTNKGALPTGFCTWFFIFTLYQLTFLTQRGGVHCVLHVDFYFLLFLKLTK